MAEPDRPVTLADYMQYIGRQLPAGVSFDNEPHQFQPGIGDRYESSVFGRLPPATSWGGAMPQSQEEAATQGPRSALPALSMLVPPVGWYMAGQNLAQAYDENRPGLGALAVGQIAGSMLWPMAGTTTLPTAATRAAPRAAPVAAPPALSPYGRWLEEQGIPPAPPPDRLIGAGGRIINNPAVTRTPSVPPTPQQQFAALTPSRAFPHTEGTTPQATYDAYLALRQHGGDYDAAIAAFPRTAPLLQRWRDAGVDGPQALSYLRGLREFRDLERPSRLNSLLPLGGALPLGLGVAEYYQPREP